MKKTTTSPEIQAEAMKVAKATQKPGQTKEQTKLISQGIEKGIAEYKKLQKQKSREQDKLKKKQQKAKSVENDKTVEASDNNKSNSTLKYQIALVASWLFFIGYFFLTLVFS